MAEAGPLMSCFLVGSTLRGLVEALAQEEKEDRLMPFCAELGSQAAANLAMIASLGCGFPEEKMQELYQLLKGQRFQLAAAWLKETTGRE